MEFQGRGLYHRATLACCQRRTGEQRDGALGERVYASDAESRVGGIAVVAGCVARLPIQVIRPKRRRKEAKQKTHTRCRCKEVPIEEANMLSKHANRLRRQMNVFLLFSSPAISPLMECLQRRCVASAFALVTELHAMPDTHCVSGHSEGSAGKGLEFSFTI